MSLGKQRRPPFLWVDQLLVAAFGGTVAAQRPYNPDAARYDERCSSRKVTGGVGLSLPVEGVGAGFVPWWKLG